MKRFTGKVLPIVMAITCMAGHANADSIYGLATQTTFLRGQNFQPENPACVWQYADKDYYSLVSAPGATCPVTTKVRMSLDIPEGSCILPQSLFYYNGVNTSNVITSMLMMYTVNGSNGTSPVMTASWRGPDSTGTPLSVGYSLIVGPSVPSGSPGCTNSDGILFRSHYYDHSNMDVLANYTFEVSLPSGTSTAFRGIAVHYYREMAPAPTFASFGDVPTTHPFFNEIEQLKKSGITLGCGNGNFCPDSPVTRAQMAVFLGRALGLQWDPVTKVPYWF